MIIVFKELQKGIRCIRYALIVCCTMFFTPACGQKFGFSNAKVEYGSVSKLTNNGCRIICYNQSIVELYAIALTKGQPMLNRDVAFNENISKVVDKKFCYELIVESKMKDSIYLIMHKNLKERFPDLTGTIVKSDSTSFLKIESKNDGILIQPFINK